MIAAKITKIKSAIYGCNNERPLQSFFGSFSTLSPVLFVEVIRWIADDPAVVLNTFGMVSRGWSVFVKQELIWRDMTLRRWKNLPKTVKVHSWLNYYRERFKASKIVKAFSGSTFYPIENCADGFEAEPLDDFNNPDYKWKFRCPINARNLERTIDPRINFCNVCQSNVYLVNSVAEAEQLAENGKCVKYSSSLSNHGEGETIGVIDRYQIELPVELRAKATCLCSMQ